MPESSTSRKPLPHKASRRPRFLKQSRCFLLCAVGVELRFTRDSQLRRMEVANLTPGGQHGEESCYEDEVGCKEVDCEEDDREEVHREEEEVRRRSTLSRALIGTSHVAKPATLGRPRVSATAKAPAQIDDGGRRRKRRQAPLRSIRDDQAPRADQSLLHGDLAFYARRPSQAAERSSKSQATTALHRSASLREFLRSSRRRPRYLPNLLNGFSAARRGAALNCFWERQLRRDR